MNSPSKPVLKKVNLVNAFFSELSFLPLEAHLSKLDGEDTSFSRKNNRQAHNYHQEILK
jgi:hypothetical protein